MLEKQEADGEAEEQKHVLVLRPGLVCPSHTPGLWSGSKFSHVSSPSPSPRVRILLEELPSQVAEPCPRASLREGIRLHSPETSDSHRGTVIWSPSCGRCMCSSAKNTEAAGRDRRQHVGKDRGRVAGAVSALWTWELSPRVPARPQYPSSMWGPSTSSFPGERESLVACAWNMGADDRTASKPASLGTGEGRLLQRGDAQPRHNRFPGTLTVGSFFHRQEEAVWSVLGSATVELSVANAFLF